MYELPSHVISQINAKVLDAVKSNSTKPTTERQAQLAADSIIEAWQGVKRDHTEAGEAHFLLVLSTLAGGGFFLAATAMGKSPTDLIDAFGVNLEFLMIKGREFPDQE